MRKGKPAVLSSSLSPSSSERATELQKYQEHPTGHSITFLLWPLKGSVTTELAKWYKYFNKISRVNHIRQLQQRTFNYTWQYGVSKDEQEIMFQVMQKTFLVLFSVGFLFVWGLFVLFHFQFGWLVGFGVFFSSWKKWNGEWMLSPVQNSNTKQNHWLL